MSGNSLFPFHETPSLYHYHVQPYYKLTGACNKVVRGSDTMKGFRGMETMYICKFAAA